MFGELSIKVLVSVKGINYIVYFKFLVIVLSDIFCKFLGINGLMGLKIILKVFVFCYKWGYKFLVV